jgi:hypothetical protein
MVIDRIEGEIAVIEIDGHTVDIPLSCLPSGAAEGDRLRFVLEDREAADQEARDRLARLQAQDNLPEHIDL